MNKVELLAPAGDLERLKYALMYGADAVYFAGKKFGLRAHTQNFTYQEMEQALEFAHNLNKKCYLVINIIAHTYDFDDLENYLIEIKDLNFDGYIISDPGVLMLAQEIFGMNREFHLSTQMSTANHKSIAFWKKQGVSRIVLARELSLDEIREIHNSDSEIELEAFIHGAMCMSYSGRCLISNYMTTRDANQGDCAQSCRWNYSLVESNREGEYFPIEEDERGSYFFNSKDLCTIDILKDIIDSGVKSLKIEGRNKTPFYVASVVRAYREAIRRIEVGDSKIDDLIEEVTKVSHRKYTHGFYDKKADHNAQVYTTSSYERSYDFIGTVLDYDKNRKLATIEQRNKFNVGDEIEIIGPDYYLHKMVVEEMYDEDGKSIQSCPHAKQIIKINCDADVKEMYMLRKKKY